MKERIYCFDFDGTIADTLSVIFFEADHLLLESGEKKISDDLLRKIREEGLEKALRGADIPPYKLFFLYHKVKKRIKKNILKAEIREGMRESLESLKKEGTILGVLTSNSKENVKEFLKEKNLDIFHFIKTSSFLGKVKELKKLKRREGIFIYIGDETSDVQAGKRAGVKTVAVPWGLSSREALLRSRPDILIEKPADLLNLPF